MSLDDLGSLWRSQPTGEVPRLSTEALRERSAQVARNARRRNVRELVGGVAGAAGVTWCGLELSPNLVSRVGCAMVVAGTVVVLAVLWARGRPRPGPAVTASTREHLAHCRAELARERDLLGSVWLWYIAPIAPGLLVWLAGLMAAIAPHAPPAWVWLTMLTTITCGAGIYVAIARANRRLSERLAREIEALDAGSEG